MKINRLNIDAVFFFDRFLSRSQFGVASVTLCGSYLNVVAGVWTWGEQADRRSAFFFSVTDGWLSFTMDCHLLLWLHFSATSLNMRLLRHTHALLQTALTDEHTLIQTDGKRQTLNTTHTHTHTHTQRTLACTSFSLTSSFCQWCTCVFCLSMLCKTCDV